MWLTCVFYIQWLEEKKTETAEELEVSPDGGKEYRQLNPFILDVQREFDDNNKLSGVHIVLEWNFTTIIQ